MNANPTVRGYIMDIVEKLKREYKPERIILFGSYAYGQPDADSDIDLFIVKDTAEPSSVRQRTVSQVTSDQRRHIALEPIVYTPREVQHSREVGDPWLSMILERGETLYERDGLTKGELLKIRPADSLVPQEWFDRADEDLFAAEALVTMGNAFRVAAFHVHQAVEMYLKGYLLQQGWKLERIHALDALLMTATTFDPDFAPHMRACERMNPYYTEKRYPVVAATPVAPDDVRQSLADAQALIALVRAKLKTP